MSIGGGAKAITITYFQILNVIAERVSASLRIIHSRCAPQRRFIAMRHPIAVVPIHRTASVTNATREVIPPFAYSAMIKLDWYMPIAVDITTKLTPVEQKNAALLKRYENYSEEYYDSFGR